MHVANAETGLALTPRGRLVAAGPVSLLGLLSGAEGVSGSASPQRLSSGCKRVRASMTGQHP